ncbi:MAG: hypothetical protein ACK4NC_05120 [Candidatus Gracilibacteria bacterium]
MQTPTQNKKSNVGLLLAILIIILAFFYIPSVYGEYQSATDVKNTANEELNDKATQLTTLEKELSEFNTVKKEDQQKMISKIPATFRQESFIDFLETVRKDAKVDIGSVSFGPVQMSQGGMKTRDIAMTIRATDKALIKTFLEKFEKADQFYAVKNVNLQTGQAIAQADIVIISYFAQ